MRSSNKFTAMALALAIGSTMSVATAFAEGEEAPSAPAVSEEITTTEANDENSEISEIAPNNEETPSNVEKFGDVTVTIENDGGKITFYDASSNMSVVCGNGVMTVDGTTIKNAIPYPTDDISRFEEIVDMVQAMNISSLTFTDSVTEVSVSGFFNNDNYTQVKFGKNISNISNDALSASASLKTVHGYKGTAAETFANAKNLEFVALDPTEIPVSTTVSTSSTTTEKNTTTTASDKKTTTASKATSTKKTSSTTTAKTSTTATTTSSSAPKTGDHGVGAVAGVLGAAAVAFAVTRKKKHE